MVPPPNKKRIYLARRWSKIDDYGSEGLERSPGRSTLVIYTLDETTSMAWPKILE